MDFKKHLQDCKEKGNFSPTDYMRQARPELFSDSSGQKVIELERALFEYHLETLTSRKQEQVFEDFCYRLAEAAICPNLKPQTGPTGGGDSQTDGTTHPVAQKLAERYYFGIPNPPAEENWAFAFSCKKKWTDKVRSDIEKIANLDREYTKAFFITSQNARDKTRARIEEELTNEYGLEVHIFDRTWILKQIFGKNLQVIAIDCLDLGSCEQEINKVGPKDRSRQERLDDLVAKLSLPYENYSSDYMLATDYRRAALLARGLENPRAEVESLFSRSVEIARKSGNTKCLLSSLYYYAWTEVWWYDNPENAIDAYVELEPLIEDLFDADDFEKLHNLLTLIGGAAKFQKIDIDVYDFSSRFKVLEDRLKEFGREEARPNNALFAEVTLCLIRISNAHAREIAMKNRGDDFPDDVFDLLFPDVGHSVAQCCGRLTAAIGKSENLLTFPFESVAYKIESFGDLIDSDCPAYEELLELTGQLLNKRRGDVAEGEMLLKRGRRHLENGKPHDTLRLIAKARFLLSKEESLDLVTECASLLGRAYLEMGLAWAGRKELMVAVYLAFGRDPDVIRDVRSAFYSTMNLCYCEIQLGKIASFLSWYHLLHEIIHKLDESFDRSKIADEVMNMQPLFCCSLLNLASQDAKGLDFLPETLERMELAEAANVLRHTLGDDSAIKSMAEDIELSEEKTLEIVEEIKKWVPVLQNRCAEGEGTRELSVKTTVMGVLYQFDCLDNLDAQMFAENALGVLEAMYALADWESFAFVTSRMVFNVSVQPASSNVAEDGWGTFNPNGSNNLKIPLDVFAAQSMDELNLLSDGLRQLMIEIVFRATVDPIDELVEELDKWHASGTFARALNCMPTWTVTNNFISKDEHDIRNWAAAPSEV